MRRILCGTQDGFTRTLGLLLAFGAAACTSDTDQTEAGAEIDTSAIGDTAAATMSIGDIGLRTPESVLHDADTDAYLVSNINGAPLERDDNGFISRITPEGQVIELKWIDGADPNVSLSAPKGMAIVDGRLLVTDIDSVRVFDLDSGEPQAAWGIADATFLNDLASAADGGVYVSDTGMSAGEGGALEPSGTPAIYRLDADGNATLLASGEALMNPNGVLADDGSVLGVAFNGNTVYRVDASGAIDTVATLPAGQLDGIVRTSTGDLLVSSWEGQAVYRIGADGNAIPLVENVEAPADIGYDAQRDRVLIPLFTGDAIEMRPVS